MAKKAKKKVDAPAGLGIKVKLDKGSPANPLSKRVTVTVTLTQDGKEIAVDSDFITL